MSGISITGYTPKDLLDTARALLTRSDSRAHGAWPRAAALLSRQALEQTLEDFWSARLPVLADASMRTQLTSLPAFLGHADVAARAAYTWACLTNACHHHAYELAPTNGELQAWIAEVERIRTTINDSVSGRAGSV